MAPTFCKINVSGEVIDEIHVKKLAKSGISSKYLGEVVKYSDSIPTLLICHQVPQSYLP